MIYIYGLICPLENNIKYVGKSKKPKTRYNQHLKKLDKQLTPKRKWLEKLSSNNIMPKLVIFATVDGDEEAREREQFFCDIHEKTILNIHSPAKGMKSKKWK